VKSKPVATDFDQVVNEAKRGHITDNLKKDGTKTIHDLEVKLSRMILTGWPRESANPKKRVLPNR